LEDNLEIVVPSSEEIIPSGLIHNIINLIPDARPIKQKLL